MFKIALKGLLAHKLRLVTTALAVMLGVAFMAGTLVLTDTIDRTFNDLFADVYKGTDAVVRGQGSLRGPAEHRRPRGRVDASLVARSAPVPGVADAEGRCSASPGSSARTARRSATRPGRAHARRQLERRRGAEPVHARGRRARRRRRRSRDRQARAPRTGPGRGRHHHGARPGGAAAGRIAGIARFGTADSPAGPPSCCSPAGGAAAHRRARQVRPDRRRRRRRASPSSSWPPSCTARCRPASRRSPARRSPRRPRTISSQALSFFTTFMLMFAVVALIVGGFMIFNTFSITVAQRTRENALLRALGASRRQVLSSVLVEAAGVGVDRLAVRSGRRGRGRRRPEVAAQRARRSTSRRRPGRPPGRRRLAAGRDRASPCVAAVVAGPQAAKVPPVAAMQQGRGQQRLRLEAADPRRLRDPGIGGRAVPRPVRRRRQRPRRRRRRRPARLPRRGRAGPHRVAAAQPVIGCAAAPPPGRDRRAGPGERHAQPQAHRVQRVGPDDRRRPGGVHHHPRLLHQGIDRRHRRPGVHR